MVVVDLTHSPSMQTLSALMGSTGWCMETGVVAHQLSYFNLAFDKYTCDTTDVPLTHLIESNTDDKKVTGSLRRQKSSTHVMQTQTTLTQMRLNMGPRPRQTPQGSTAVRRVTV